MRRNLSNLISFLLMLFFSLAGFSQENHFKGRITDQVTKKPIPKATIILKGTSYGTLSNEEGYFDLATGKLDSPVLLVSYTNYDSVEISPAGNEVLEIQLQPTYKTGEEIVVLATGTAIDKRKSPVTIERMGLSGIVQAPSPNFYEGLSNLRGVDMTISSHLFRTASTRGFNGSGNYRMNQFMDGMNNMAPGLNFSVGNFLGMTELDAESVELLPGASSALYGSGGLNGTLLMTSKSPFTYPGLSIQLKQGVMHVNDNEAKASPYYDWSLRYAHSFNNKFAFKFNAQYIKADDWVANDTSNLLRSNTFSKFKPGTRASDPNYDGVNIYGDELNANMYQIGQLLVLQGILPSQALQLIPQDQNVSRTGYAEKDLVDYKAYSLKFSGGLYYRINSNIEASLSGYYGKGTTVYTGSDRYSLKGVNMGQYKAEIKSKNWFLRAYTTQEDAGEAYNTTALASYINETWKPSQIWFPTYVANYVGAVSAGMPGEQAHQFARGKADEGRLIPGTAEFNEVFKEISSRPIKDKGAKFIDKSDLWDFSGQWNLTDKIRFAEVLVGANYKEYILNSEGTIFSDSSGHIRIPEYGGFVQVQKAFWDNKLKLGVSGRYDKQKNFQGRFTPRFTALYSFNPNQNIRFSYQTGYRFPANEDQYIDLNTGVVHLIGALPEFFEANHFSDNPVYTAESIAAYRESMNPNDLVLGTYQKIKPETVKSFELGYHGKIGKSFDFDLFGYLANYENFLGRVAVGQPMSPATRDQDLISSFRTQNYGYRQNLSEKLKAYGLGIGLGYRVGGNYHLTFNASTDQLSKVPTDFITFFNTPKYRLNAGIGNANVWKNFGFQVNYRWQDQFKWEGTFGTGDVPSYGTVDAQISYELPKKKSQIKIGGSNLFNKYYNSAFGNPKVGGLYYVSLKINLF